MLIVEIKSKKARQFSSIVIYFDNGKVLLLKRKDKVPYGGKWGFPGGGAEKGESPKEAGELPKGTATTRFFIGPPTD